MVREGIPHSLRPYVWLRLAGAMQKKTSSEVYYRQVRFIYVLPCDKSPVIYVEIVNMYCIFSKVDRYA